MFSCLTRKMTLAKRTKNKRGEETRMVETEVG
jgi:hypothetical protein